MNQSLLETKREPVCKPLPFSAPQADAAPAPAWGWLVVLFGLAVALRIGLAGEWSLWQDEETSIYFSQQPDKPFPSHFPLYFYALRGLFTVTGISIPAGRWLSAILGVASIGTSWITIRRFAGSRVAFYACLLMTLSLGHLFWSQSIRYYILLFLLQTIAIGLFLEGFEYNKLWCLWLANLVLLLSVLTHFSAALLFPVFVAHLAVCIWKRERTGGYHWLGYVSFLVPFAMVGGAFCWLYFDFRSSMADLITSENKTNLAGLLLRITVYQGVAPIALAAMAPWIIAGNARNRITQFLLVTAFLPQLELLVMGSLNLVIVLWYQAFFAILGLCALAGYSIVATEQRRGGWCRQAVVIAIVLMSTPLLVGYYTTMHGDRSRWREAMSTVKRHVTSDRLDQRTDQVVAMVPGVAAYYLGVAPGHTMGHPWVLDFSVYWPARSGMKGTQWVVVEVGRLTADQQRWFDLHGTLIDRYESISGPKDRSLAIYRVGAAENFPAEPTGIESDHLPLVGEWGLERACSPAVPPTTVLTFDSNVDNL